MHLSLVFNVPSGKHRPTGHPLAYLARFLGCPQPLTAPPERWLRGHSFCKVPSVVRDEQWTCGVGETKGALGDGSQIRLGNAQLLLPGSPFLG